MSKLHGYGQMRKSRLGKFSARFNWPQHLPIKYFHGFCKIFLNSCYSRWKALIYNTWKWYLQKEQSKSVTRFWPFGLSRQRYCQKPDFFEVSISLHRNKQKSRSRDNVTSTFLNSVGAVGPLYWISSICPLAYVASIYMKQVETFSL